MPLAALAAVAVTLLLWASAFVAIRHLVGTFTPGALSLGRLLVGSVALGAALLLGRRVLGNWVPPTRDEWVRLVVIGLLWFALYNVALNAGEQRVDAGTAALLIQLSPVVVALLAAGFLGERLTPMFVVGLAVAFAGVALIATSTSEHQQRDPWGVVLCLVSAAAYAVSVVLQKPLAARLPAVQITWTACAVGALACLPFVSQLVNDASRAEAADLGWVVFLGLFPTAVAFTTYAYALSHMDAGRLSVTTYPVPPITVVMSWLLIGEVPPPLAYVGGVLCLVGVALTRRRRAVG